MKTTTKKITDTKVELKVVLTAADLAPAREQAVAGLAANLKVAGFRKGKAPLSLVEKQLSANDIASETIEVAVRMYLDQALKESSLNPLAIQGINVTKYVPGETAEYTATLEILPDVKLGDLKKIKVEAIDTTASEQDVQEILDNIQKAYAEHKAAKKAATLGDGVIIDFVGKKDGKAFEGGTAKDYHLELGSGSFIPGFEDGIVGHSSGDKFDLALTFPQEYHNKELAGQDVVFEVLLKQVDEVTLPTLDDELAKKCGDFKTLADLKADIKKNLEMQNQHRADEQRREAAVQALVEASKVLAPEILVKDQLRFIRDDVVRNAASRGMGFEDYLTAAGQTIADWEAEAMKIAEARVKASLVLQVLARDQGIQASDEEVDAKIAELKDVYQKSPEALKNLKQPAVRQDLRNRLIIDKTMDFLMSQVGEGKPTKAKKPAKSGKAKATKKSAKTTK